MKMNNLYTFVNNKMTPIDDCIKDDYMQELLDTEFGEKESLVSDETNDLIKRYGFSVVSLVVLFSFVF